MAKYNVNIRKSGAIKYLPAFFIFCLPIITQSQLSVLSQLQVNDSCGIHLSKAIQFRTISFNDPTKTDVGAFLGFKQLLENTYPLVHCHLQRTIINEMSYIYEWKGKDSSLLPYVLMAHQDVVPVEEESISEWTVDPFAGTIRNDTIFGRGAVDDKCSLIGIMEAAETLLSQGFQPDRTIYFCFGQDEEVSGPKGAKAIVEWFQQKNIHPELVLDEGLEVIEKKLSLFKKPVALIGVAEKGYASFTLTVEKSGGHSAAPEKETAISILTTALVKLNTHPPPAKLIPPIKDFLERVRQIAPSNMRLATNNLWLFKSKLLKKMGDNNGTNAIVRTTIVPTIIKGGLKDNVIPAVANATVNCRILPSETIDQTEKFIKNEINDSRVKITLQKDNHESSSFTDVKGNAFKKIESLANRFFPNAVEVPMIVIGYTDSRYFRSISNGVINFEPVVDSDGQHGANERRSITEFKKMIRFYAELMRNSL